MVDRPRIQPPQLLPTEAGRFLRVVAAGLFTGVLAYIVLFYETGEGAKPPVPSVTFTPTPVPQVDPQILAQVRDTTRNDRIPAEPAVLSHLLERSLRVVPAVAKALGLPAQPVPIDALRADPARWRGKYLWYKGKLEQLEVHEGHPVRGYRVYDARIETAEGEQVLFHFSVPPPSTIEVGSWVRAEGFFMKLRDAHFPVPVTQAPMLVGPELQPAYPDWQPVEELDQAVLGAVRDGIRDDGMDVDLQEATASLFDSQDVPLWHLASYAQEHRERRGDEPEPPLFRTRKLWSDAYEGRIQRGQPFRLVGDFRWGRVVEARPNPLGVDYWSEVWIHNHDLGHRPFAVWLPKDIGSWNEMENAVCTGYFFKRFAYVGADDSMHFTPLFVAADLHRQRLVPHPSNRVWAWVLGGTAFALMGLFFVLARLERRARARHEDRMSERRRQRRQSRTEAAPACR